MKYTGQSLREMYLNFFKEKAVVAPEEMARIAQSIAEEMQETHSELF